MIAKKGGTNHRIFGWLYTIAMTMIFITAFPASLVKQNYFLLAISVFSFYLTITGIRSVFIKKQKHILFADRAFITLFMLSAFIMCITAIFFLLNNKLQGIILLVFGSIFLVNTIQDFKAYCFRNSTWENHKWFFSHLTRMNAAYIATFTAFAVTNITFLPEMATWLLPSVIGSVVISLTVRHYKEKMK